MRTFKIEYPNESSKRNYCNNECCICGNKFRAGVAPSIFISFIEEPFYIRKDTDTISDFLCCWVCSDICAETWMLQRM